MSKSTIKNLLIYIAFLFYLSACAEGSSGSGSGSDDGVIRTDGGNNGSNVLEGRAIDIGDEWLYRKGTSAPPSDWISVGFDDSTWLAGNSGIGYGDDDDATILSDMSGSYATVYTRKIINYDGSFNIDSLTLDIDYDDGFVAYINGQEVARANMPTGQPSFDTLANISHEAGTAESFNLDGFTSLINIGDNVLAIEIHNSRLASSDLSFLPLLLVNMEELPPLPTVSLSANPTSVVTNGSTTLNWSSTDATSCTASGDWSGNMATSGSQPINGLTTNSSFNLACTGVGGTANDSVSVTVTDPSAPTVNLSASPMSVAYNDSTTLTWSSNNTTGCTATGDWSGSLAASGSQPINGLTTNSSFNLACTGAGGTANDSVSVTVDDPATPTVNLSASPMYVPENGSTTLSWTGSNVDSCTASGDWSGNMASSGSQMINDITTNSSFDLSCSGTNGSANDSVNITVYVPGGETELQIDGRQLQYKGAFRLSAGTYGSSSVNYAVGVMTYNPDNHSIFIAGHSTGMAIAEFSIPTISASPILTDLNTGSNIQPFITPLNNVSNPESRDRVTGMQYVNGQLILNAERKYDTSATNDSTLVIRNADDIDGSIDGYFELDSRQWGSGWISPIPSEWHAAFGGAEYLTGWTSNNSIVSRYSVGPSLWALDSATLLADVQQSGQVTATAYMNFPHTYPGDGEHHYIHPTAWQGGTGGTHPMWNQLSRAFYGFIVPGTSTYAVFGENSGIYSGVGYKITQDNGNVCGGYCAYEADDAYNYYWLFDVQEILNAANVWDPQPYAYGELSIPFDHEGGKFHDITGGTFDQATGTLYISLEKADRENGRRAPVIVAYQLQ